MSDGPVEQIPSATDKPAPMPSPAGGAGSGWGKGEDRRPPRPEQLVLDLDGYEGPIDLLLSLAREQKVDLAKISILALADQYLGFIAAQRQLKIEIAADYLVMAAWLAYLKSRLLLPQPQERRAGGRGSRRRTRASAAAPRSDADRWPHVDGALAARTGFLFARRPGGPGNGAGSGLAARALRAAARLWRQPPPNDECGVGRRALGLLIRWTTHCSALPAFSVECRTGARWCVSCRRTFAAI